MNHYQEAPLLPPTPFLLQSKPSLGCLTVDVSRSHIIKPHTHTHTHTHTHPVGLPWTNDQLVAEAATYTTRISMSSPGTEPAIPVIKQRQPTPNTALPYTRASHMKTLNKFNLVIYWTQKVHNDFIFLCSIVLPYVGHSSNPEYHYGNLQDNRAVVRTLIALLRFSFDSPSYMS